VVVFQLHNLEKTGHLLRVFCSRVVTNYVWLRISNGKLHCTLQKDLHQRLPRSATDDASSPPRVGWHGMAWKVLWGVFSSLDPFRVSFVISSLGFRELRRTRWDGLKSKEI
jgi:hypothetical protein